MADNVKEVMTEETELQKKEKKRKELIRVLKFALFSASAGIIEFVSIAILDAVTPWRHFYCYLIGLVLSVLWNFTLNRKFTFKSANNVPIAMLKVAAFYAVFTPFSTWLDKVITEDSGWAGTSWVGYVSTIIIMLMNLTTEFLYDRFFVFRNSIDTNDVAEKDEEKAAAKMAAEAVGLSTDNGTAAAAEEVKETLTESAMAEGVEDAKEAAAEAVAAVSDEDFASLLSGQQDLSQTVKTMISAGLDKGQIKDMLSTQKDTLAANLSMPGLSDEQKSKLQELVDENASLLEQYKD